MCARLKPLSVNFIGLFAKRKCYAKRTSIYFLYALNDAGYGLNEFLVASFSTLYCNGTITKLVREFCAFDYFIFRKSVAFDVLVVASNTAIQARFLAAIAIFD